MDKKKVMSSFDMYLMAISAMGEFTGISSDNKAFISDIDSPPKNAPIPKVAKEYFFSEDGRIFHADNIAACYSCISINKKSARRKFLKWLEQKKQTAPATDTGDE